MSHYHYVVSHSVHVDPTTPLPPYSFDLSFKDEYIGFILEANSPVNF